MAAFAAASPTSTPARERSAARRCGTGSSKLISVPRASSSTALGVGCAAMFAANIDVGTWVNAGVSVVVALVIAFLLDRVFRGIEAREPKVGLSREGSTRLRFVRRLIYALI